MLQRSIVFALALLCLAVPGLAQVPDTCSEIPPDQWHLLLPQCPSEFDACRFHWPPQQINGCTCTSACFDHLEGACWQATSVCSKVETRQGATPFNYPSPTGIQVAGIQEQSSAYKVTLSATGSPVISCWKDSGLLGKACSLLTPAHTAGWEGYVSSFSSPPTYDLRELYIDKGASFPFDPTPDWSIPVGCVSDVEALGAGVFLITIDDGLEEAVVRCVQGDAFVGNLFGRVCPNLAAGDCGTFEGDNGPTWPELKQIVARFDF